MGVLSDCVVCSGQFHWLFGCWFIGYLVAGSLGSLVAGSLVIWLLVHWVVWLLVHWLLGCWFIG